MSYRYDRFRREHLRDALAFQSGKDPGWQAPDFDLPTTQGVVVFATTCIIIFNLVVDVLYAWVDPRIRLT